MRTKTWAGRKVIEWNFLGQSFWLDKYGLEINCHFEELKGIRFFTFGWKFPLWFYLMTLLPPKRKFMFGLNGGLICTKSELYKGKNMVEFRLPEIHFGRRGKK